MFGSNPSGNTGGLFGATAPASSGNSTGSTSLFGNSGNTQSGGIFGGGSSLFSGNQQQSSSLFGNQNTSQPQTSSSGGLFGNSSNSGTSGLFGSSNMPSASGSLFGGSFSNTGSSLFGGNAGNQNTGSNSGGLFGSSNPGSTSLFGNVNQGQQSSGGLFTSAGQQQPAQQQVFNQNTQTANFEKMQLVNTFLPLVFYTDASSLKFQSNRRQDNVEQMAEVQQSVQTGTLPQQMQNEILKIHLKINQAHATLDSLKQATMPELDDLDTIMINLGNSLVAVKNDLTAKEESVSEIITSAKMSAKLSEKVLHDTRRCNNNYNLIVGASSTTTESNTTTSSVLRYSVLKTIPSDFFVELLGVLNSKLKECERNLATLEEYMSLSAVESQKKPKVSREAVDLPELMRRQYEYFIRVASLIAQTNKRMNILRDLHSTKYGTNFAESEVIENLSKEKLLRQIEKNAANVNLSEILAAQIKPSLSTLPVPDQKAGQAQAPSTVAPNQNQPPLSTFGTTTTTTPTSSGVLFGSTTSPAVSESNNLFGSSSATGGTLFGTTTGKRSFRKK